MEVRITLATLFSAGYPYNQVPQYLGGLSSCLVQSPFENQSAALRWVTRRDLDFGNTLNALDPAKQIFKKKMFELHVGFEDVLIEIFGTGREFFEIRSLLASFDKYALDFKASEIYEYPQIEKLLEKVCEKFYQSKH